MFGAFEKRGKFRLFAADPNYAPLRVHKAVHRFRFTNESFAFLHFIAYGKKRIAEVLDGYVDFYLICEARGLFVFA